MRRRLPALALAVLVAVLLTAAPSASASLGTPRVVGGTTATTATAPWQALVLPGDYLCGGSILDATHVVTAAHCVYDEDTHQVVAPSTVTVEAGIVDRVLDVGQQRAVTAISVDPAYAPDLQTSDVAVLTLSTSLTYDAAVQPIALTAVGWRPVPGVTPLQLSGWGSTQQRSPDADADVAASQTLQVVDVTASTTCSTVYSPYDDNLLLCAGQAGRDACQGDSGGPLAVQDHGVWELAGVVTGGAGCAWPGYPGYYARVSEAGINAFLAAGYPLAVPVITSPPTISGSAQVGGTLRCDPGTWENAHTYGVDFLDNGRLVAQGASLTLGPGDLGATVSCVVAAFGLTGSAEARSASVVVAPQPAAPTPAAPVTPPPAATDTAAPTARLTRIRCAHAVCVLEVHVVDPAPSAGVAGLDARVQTAYRTTCHVKGKRRRCTRTAAHRLRAVIVAPNTYTIKTPRLRAGRQTFTLIGIDALGHRQARATTVTRTTR